MVIRMCRRGLDSEYIDVQMGSDLIAHADTVSEQIKEGKYLPRENDVSDLYSTRKHHISSILYDYTEYLDASRVLPSPPLLLKTLFVFLY